MPTTRRTITGRSTNKTTGKTNTRKTTGKTTNKTTGKSTSKTTGRKSFQTSARSTSKTSAKRGSKTTAKSSTTQQGWSPAQFGTVRQTIQSRVGSFKNIASQVNGPGKVTTFSPRTATQWTNFVNQGNNVYKFSTQQIKKTFGNKFSQQASPTTVNRWFRQKFGPGVKAVARGRGSSWLVAASSNVNKGPFRNYSWK
jgi:hypothetical protein